MKQYFNTMLTAGLLLMGAARPAEVIHADLVLSHGRIITMNPNDDVFQALAVSGGRIVEVGSDSAIQHLIGSDTRVIDLRGRAVTPGLIDSHAHVMGSGLSELFELDLSDAHNIKNILDRVAKRAAAVKPGEWIVGAGWDEAKLVERRYPTAVELDGVSRQNPVWLENTSGHYGVANSMALKHAGIDASTPAPAAGVIEHASDGKPTGELKESAQDLVLNLIPPYTPEQRHQALVHMVALAHSEGMTGFKDPDISQEDWEAYRVFDTTRQLNTYVCVLFHTPPTLEAARTTLRRIQSAQNDLKRLRETTLSVCGAKIYMDGSAMARTAWLYEDWNRTANEIEVGNHGFPALDPNLYQQQVKLFVDAGVGVGTHAIGDRAIDWVADTYAKVLMANPKQGLRLSIIHAYLPTDHALKVMKDLQRKYDAGYPETQAEFLWWLGGNYPGAFGVARSRGLMPLQSYLQKGIIWSGGSDTNVTPFPARYGLWASVAREALTTTTGESPFGAAESVDIHESLRSYTIWAARQLFREKQTGSLERGKYADFAIWDRDPYRVPTDQLKEMVCEMTAFRGKIVYERGTTP
ncbi:MAG: amidohydrolase [Gammaproteobacteria bacterium]